MVPPLPLSLWLAADQCRIYTGTIHLLLTITGTTAQEVAEASSSHSGEVAWNDSMKKYVS